MKYLRLFTVSFLLTIAITGCHRRSVQVLPPVQAQAPIVSTLPPMPPLIVPSAQAGEPEPAVKIAPPTTPATPKKNRTAKVHHHRSAHKPETATASTTPVASTTSATNGSPIGPLSADDAVANPKQSEQTEHLIQTTEDRLKKISAGEQAAHKDAIAQVQSFLTQAQQALSMNDMVGAQTLANKAKILLDELLK